MVSFAADRPRETAPVRSTAAAGQGGASVSRRTALLSIVGFWFFSYLINTLRMAITATPLGDQLSFMVRRAAVVLAGIAFTYVLLLVLRRLDGRSLPMMIATAFVAALPVCFAYSIFNFYAFYVVDPLPATLEEMAHDKSDHGNPFLIVIDHALTWYFFIAAWAVFYVALSYAGKMRQAERNAALYRAEAQNAQLRALRYQINPHFLFNTLNSLSTLVLRQRSDEAERMILNLSKFFRTSLTADPAADIPLADEIRMQRLYLDIERVRFPDRLLVTIDVPVALESAPVPGLILQPLVENAIKYGVARSTRPVTVSIRAAREHDQLRLVVEDDGATAGTAAAPPADGAGVGLRNVRQRLSTRFGMAAFCEYGPAPGGGFRVDIVLPLAVP